jgi:acylphosphatase
MNNVKNIQAIVKGNVNMVGYRKVVEGYGLSRGLAGYVFNISTDTVGLMAGGLESAIDGFIQDLKVKRPDTEIKTIEIKEDIILPSPFGRVISGDMREIGERLDKGVNILSDHTGLLDDLKENTSILTEHTGLLNDLKENTSVLTEHTGLLTEHTGSLNKQTELLQGINDNFNTLPERIAEAIMKR